MSNLIPTTDNKVTSLLKLLDLSSTEQSLYLRGLAHGEASVRQLIHDVSINRTTAYHALGTLKQKGFTREVKRQGVLYYRMTPANELHQLLSGKQALLESHKQSLAGLAHLFPKPAPTLAKSSEVDTFEGIENVKLAIEKALYCTSRKWSIIAPRDNFFSQIDKQYAEYFMQARRERGIQAQTLWEPSLTNQPQSGLSLEEILMRKPRYLDKQLAGSFTSVVILFDDQILYLPPLQEAKAILVSSPEIYSTMTVLFKGLWQASKA